MGTCNTKHVNSRSLDDRTKVSLDMFMFQSVLGEGGFGKVMCGIFVHTDKWHAVKAINKKKLLNLRTGMKMLQNELNSLKRIPPHPFICGIHYAFHDKVSCYFVLDLKKGGDLRYYLEERGRVFSERDVAIYVSCLSAALEHIHSHGVIHRDVKPDNIVLDGKGFPCLSDFGVAYVANDGNLICTLASGTKSYLAPEVFTSRHIHGPECDYWSLGVVAYEMLYGRRPYDKKVPREFVIYAEALLSEQWKDATLFTPATRKRKQDDSANSDTDPNQANKSALSSRQSDWSSSSGEGTMSSGSTNQAQSAYSEIDATAGNIPTVKPSRIIRRSTGDTEVSSQFIDVLQGLMDVRPLNRYGGENIGRLLGHEWFHMHSINHEAVINRDDSVKPHFQPGESFIRDTCLCQDHYAVEDATSDNENNDYPMMAVEQQEEKDIEQRLDDNISLWEQQRFADFYYCREPF